MRISALLIFIFSIPLALFAQTYDRDIEYYRLTKMENYKTSPNSPIAPSSLHHLHYYAPDEHYKVVAEVELLIGESSFRMPTYDGTSNEYKKFAILHFSINEQPQSLTVYQSTALFQSPVYRDHLFLPFLDQTNGDETYSGGRYIDLDRKQIKKGKIEIDFNKAYNPYCAYSSGYRCPQPPSENRLDIPIEAGEKTYTGPINVRAVNKELAKNFTNIEKEIILSGGDTEKMKVYQITETEELETLRTPSTDIAVDDPSLPILAARMLATVKHPESSGVGIAAPQVGINKNIIWVQRLDKDGEPFELYLNPKIIWRSELLQNGAEGCLSIPDQREDVWRNYVIRLQHWDSNGNVIEEMIEGFTAVIFQHEVDHLYGILFTDRLEEQTEQEYESLNEDVTFGERVDIVYTELRE